MTNSNLQLGGEVALYQTPDGQVRLDVRLERETVWLSLSQMAELFGRDKSVISRHLRNVFETGELNRQAVVAKNATTAADGKTYQVEYFDLDAILSVGYRVNSKRGTQFRIWATRTLRDHLVQGYTLNERRLREKGLAEMEQAMRLLAHTLSAHELVTEQGRAVLDVVAHYARSWRLLVEYDENRLPEAPARPMRPVAGLSPEDARRGIGDLKQALMARGEATTLFGQERGGAPSAKPSHPPVLRPERRRVDDRVAVCELQQIFVASDQVVDVCHRQRSHQRAKNRSVIRIAQLGILGG